MNPTYRENPAICPSISQLVDQAGIPKGVFNIVTSSDAKPVGRELSTNSTIHKLTFTNSTSIGKILMRQAAGIIKKLTSMKGLSVTKWYCLAECKSLVSGVNAQNRGRTSFWR